MSGRFSRLSHDLASQRRETEQPRSTGGRPAPQTWVWPMGAVLFAVDDVLRRAWRLDHLGRPPVEHEIEEARSCVATLTMYVDSLPEVARTPVSREIVRRLGLEPRSTRKEPAA